MARTKQAQKTSQPENPGQVRNSRFSHPTGKLPKKVALVGLGPTKSQYIDGLVPHAGNWDEYDEIWGINTAIKWLKRCDLLWVMDDIDLYTRHAPAYKQALMEAKCPIMTNNMLYKEFPTLVSYPDPEVLSFFNGAYAYFNHSSLPWILAYLIWLGSVEKLALWGIDYSSPDKPSKELETGRFCAEYWLGRVSQAGTELAFPVKTTIMDRHLYPGIRPYGYLKPPYLTVDNEPVWL